MTMNILFVSQYFPPEMGAPAARVSELAKAWAAAGHEVTVLTGLGSHPTGVVPPPYRGRLFIRESRDGYQVVRVWLYATPNRGFARRVLNFISFFASAVILGAALTRRPDVVIGTSPQIFIGAAGLALARLKRAPFVFEVRDLWPQTAIDLGALRNRQLIAVTEWLEQTLYRASSRIVVVSEEFSEHVLARGIAPERIRFVPNGVDAHGALASGRDPPAEARRVEGKVTVAYIGTHGMCQGLATIVAVAERLRDDPGIRFLFVGDGAEKDGVKRRAAEARLRNCTFLDAVPREQVAGVYRESDVCLVPLIDRPVFRTVLPSKMFEIMAMGRPILLSVGGRAEQLLAAAGAGLAVAPENVDAIVAGIRRLASDPEARRRMGEAGRAYVAEHYDREVLAARYAGYLAEVCA